MDASLSEFQVVQQALLAGRKLEITLKTYIEEYDTMALMDATGDAEGVQIEGNQHRTVNQSPH